MHVPIVGRDRRRKSQLARRTLRVRFVEVPVEADAQRVEVEGGVVARARWKDHLDTAEPVVEIFEARGPVRRDGQLGADAANPPGARMQDLVLVGTARILEETRL